MKKAIKTNINKYAILIGCNYLGTPNQLSGCQNDVVLFSDILANKFGYPRENIILLIEKSGYQLPNYDNIINSLNTLVTKSIKGQALEILFYYSGHGSSIIDNSKDEPDRRDEVIIPLDFGLKGIISDDYIYEKFILKINKLTNVYFIFDSCNSASCADLPVSYEIIKNRVNRRILSNRILYSTRIFSLSGCYDSAFSYEFFDPELKLIVGALSYAIRKVLKDRNYICNLQTLLTGVHNFLASNNVNQTPILSSGMNLAINTIQFL